MLKSLLFLVCRAWYISRQWKSVVGTLFLSQRLDLLSWFYVYLLGLDLLSNLIHHLASSSFSVYAPKNCYTISSTHDITINGLWFTTLGGNYPWLVYLQLDSCHARTQEKSWQKGLNVSSWNRIVGWFWFTRFIAHPTKPSITVCYAFFQQQFQLLA